MFHNISGEGYKKCWMKNWSSNEAQRLNVNELWLRNSREQNGGNQNFVTFFFAWCVSNYVLRWACPLSDLSNFEYQSVYMDRLSKHTQLHRTEMALSVGNLAQNLKSIYTLWRLWSFLLVIYYEWVYVHALVVSMKKIAKLM